MNPPTFVRGLWGETSGSEFPTCGRDRISRTLRFWRHQPVSPKPLKVYCWGLENAELLRRRWVEPIVVQEQAISDFGRAATQPRDSHPGPETKAGHQMNWGLSFWHHKLQAMRLALEEHEAIIWLDLDVWQMKPLPKGFWRQLAKGPPFQARLRQYRRRQCSWRDDRHEPRLVPHGACMYCRNLSLIEEAIEIHKSFCPEATDEIVFARWIDLEAGGFLGSDGYLAKGYELECYDQRRQCFWEVDPAKVIFKNLGKR